MLPDVTQSFKLQRPELGSCRAEAMLRLFIAEHRSTAYKHATIWKRSSGTVCHTKKRGKLQLRCSKVKMLTDRNCGPKSVLAKTDIFSPCLLRASKRRKISLLSGSWNAHVLFCLLGSTSSKAALEQISRAWLYFCRAPAVCKWISAFFSQWTV